MDERTTSADVPMTLGAELRSVARARILRAACTMLARHGFDATADEVAREAGVSRRTVFRYFPTHGQLLAAAVASILASFESVLPAPPEGADDLERWLTGLAVDLHRFNVERVGQAFWDISAARPGTAPELVEVLATVAPARLRYGKQIAAAAWRVAGGRGAPPAWVVDSFVQQLSGFGHHGLGAGVPRTPEETGRTSARILAAVLAVAVGR